MIFGTPISWFINEVFSAVLILFVLSYISRQKKPFICGLELLAYMLGAGVFENIGVWGNTYNYSTARVMMFGKVPVAILLVEGAIFYMAFQLVQKLKLPKWAMPLGVGFLASVQDLTLDPASVYDKHLVLGKLLGQWNWNHHYTGGILGIPFFNFSGWLTMMLYFTAAILLGRYLSKKINRKWFSVSYPCLAAILMLILIASPVNLFLLYGFPFAQMNQKIPELIMLIFNYAVTFSFLTYFVFRAKKVDWKGSRMVFVTPLVLHIYALINSIVNGINFAIPLIIIVAILHLGYLALIYQKTKRESDILKTN